MQVYVIFPFTRMEHKEKDVKVINLSDLCGVSSQQSAVSSQQSAVSSQQSAVSSQQSAVSSQQ
jgi:hypothetical protein